MLVFQKILRMYLMDEPKVSPLFKLILEISLHFLSVKFETVRTKMKFFTWNTSANLTTNIRKTTFSEHPQYLLFISINNLGLAYATIWLFTIAL